MSMGIEREFTFLLNELPVGLDKFPSKILEDNYIPADSEHPVVRIRRNGDKLSIVKKYPADADNSEVEGDSSRMIEHTIPLSHKEYDFLNQLDGKRLKKRRFFYEIDGKTADIDVFLDKLAGLVLIDFEFNSEEEMSKFIKPDFIGADVTQDSAIAGGILAGKSYADIADALLEEYNYKPLKNIEKYEEVK